MDRCIGQIAGLGIVRECEMRHRHHLAHEFHLSLSDAIIKTTAITKDRVYKNRRSQGTLFLAVASHHPGLFIAEHQTRTDGIEREAQFFPHGQCTTYILGGILNVEFPVV